jgi:hypothetical protein
MIAAEACARPGALELPETVHADGRVAERGVAGRFLLPAA